MYCADYFWLRSAGFSAHHILQSESFTGQELTRELITLYQHRERLLKYFEQQIAAVGEDHCRKFARKVAALVSFNLSDLPLVLRDSLQESVEEWQQVTNAIKQREPEAQQKFDTFSEHARQQLIDFLLREDVAEAIFISNPDAAQRISDLIADRNAPHDSRKKQKIRLGWSYAQRFCTKNDTSSFFGPIAWGRFDNQQQNLAELTGCEQPWLAQRITFFESWVIQRIIQQINLHYPQQQHLPLRMNPGCYLHGSVLHYPLNKSRVVSGTVLEVLRLITQGITRESELCIRQKQDRLPVIDHLLNAGILRRGFQISPREPNALAELLQSMKAHELDPQYISKWSACFLQLETLREHYAAGNLTQRQKALEAIRNTLQEADVSLTRDSGKMYVGRYPLYEDCARASSVTFSRKFQHYLHTDFQPIMSLYRWLTRAAGFALHEAWLEIYHAEISSENMSEQDMSLLKFLNVIQTQQQQTRQKVIKKIRAMLANAWSPVLNSVEDDEVSLSQAQINQVLASLNEMCPQVNTFTVFGEDFHSPDFMLAAQSIQALNHGEFLIVLGETHPGVHTLSQPVAAPFCPFTKEIEQTVNKLFGRQRFMLADSPGSYQRSHIDWPLIPNYAQIILPDGGGCVSTTQRYPVGRARVLITNARLTVEDIEGQFQEDLICVCSTELHHLLFDLAADIIPRYDTRRIIFNRTVYKRQTWQFNSDAWPNTGNDEYSAFILWQLWQKKHELPRWVFIKCDSEPKPLFIDFENPLSLDVLATALKKSHLISVSEMLPTPDDLWMNDSRGSVCCEVRTTFSPLTSEEFSHAE